MKETTRTWLFQRTPEAFERYRVTRKNAASVVADANTRAREEFAEAMEKNFQSFSKKFWQMVKQLRKRKRTLSQAVPGFVMEVLTQTENIVELWKEHFEDLFNPPTISIFEEAELDSVEGESITVARVTEIVIKKKSPWWQGVRSDEICPEMLKGLDVVECCG